MIVAMKKAAIILQAQDTGPALKELRKVGILHIEHQQPPAGQNISLLKEDIALTKEAINIITQKEFYSRISESKEPSDWKHLARHIIDSRKRMEQLQEFGRSLIAQISQWEAWGDFDPQQIQLLKGKGIHIKLYQIPRKDLADIPGEFCVKTIFSSGASCYASVIAQEDFSLPFKELALPRTGLEAMRKKLAEGEKVLGGIQEELCQHSAYYQGLLKTKKKLEKELEFQEAIKGMGQADGLAYLTGYVPFDKVEPLLVLTKKEKWGISVDEPSQDDAVPTLLRNKRWITIISPIFKLLEVIPGYRELDVSFLFLVFLSLFFGMIIGDAGYGLIYLLLTAYAKRKMGKKLKGNTAFLLFYVMSSCTILWGLVTGTIFGQAWHLKTGLKPLIPALNDARTLQTFCFFLGAFHLTLAHAWRALLQMPALTVFAEAGWIAVLWAAFFLAKTLILGDVFPAFGKWLAYGGIALVILCSSPQRNILRAIGKGLATVALSLVNNFTDVVSYIRLFAVGLAGVAIADTVNTIAASAGGSNWLVIALILLAGHTINIVLGPMSVLVHGVRLNVLEFSGHAGVTWSGVKYQPLQE